MDIDAIKAALALGRLKWGNLDADANAVFEQADAALASSPAPTGAEPVAWRRMNKQRTQSTAVTDVKSFADQWAKAGDIIEPLYASPQPVAPTGEIAGLVERLNKAAAAITSQREHIRKQAEDIMTLGRLAYPKDGIGADDTWKARCAASEAEAADLRRKLEEHQDAEDKAAREMATVIQGLRNRATAAERKLEEAREALEVIAASDDIENALDPARNKRVAARALSTQVEERE